MSDNNQMAINPYVAGGIGTAAGATAGYFIHPFAPVKNDYNDAKKLLTMEEDSFKSVATEGSSATGEVKTNFDIITEGRKKISEAGDSFELNTVKPAKEGYETELNNLVNANAGDAEFKDLTATAYKNTDGKTIAELETAMADAETAAKVAENADVKAADKALQDAIAKVDVTKEDADIKAAKDAVAPGATPTATEQAAIDAAEKAKADKIANATQAEEKALAAAKKKALESNSGYTTARKALEDAKADRFKKIEEALGKKAGAETDKAAGPFNAILKKVTGFKETMAKKFDVAKEADELLKDTKYGTAFDKIKGILPKAKMWPTIIGAAALGIAGVALSYIVGPKNETPQDVA